jgi:pectinesterase
LKDTSYGFVFINCNITGDAEANTFYLGRPWRPFAKTVFVNCFLDKQIRAEGWNNWNKPEAEQTTYYAEYGSKGPGANPTSRVKWSHQITESEAKELNARAVLGGGDNWDPTHPGN